ncbi:hypothetical protein DFAR_3630001 [Desulfarculales bacterium]
MDKLDLGEDVLFTGYMPQEDLPLMMNVTLAFVFPSLHEGISLPALKAISCGTPLIISNFSFLPEIVGQTALLVESQDEEEIAMAMWRVFEGAQLRQGLRKLGLTQTARLCWQKAALQTMKVYMAAHEEAGRL